MWSLVCRLVPVLFYFIVFSSLASVKAESDGGSNHSVGGADGQGDPLVLVRSGANISGSAQTDLTGPQPEDRERFIDVSAKNSCESVDLEGPLVEVASNQTYYLGSEQRIKANISINEAMGFFEDDAESSSLQEVMIESMLKVIAPDGRRATASLNDYFELTIFRLRIIDGGLHAGDGSSATIEVKSWVEEDPFVEINEEWPSNSNRPTADSLSTSAGEQEGRNPTYPPGHFIDQDHDDAIGFLLSLLDLGYDPDEPILELSTPLQALDFRFTPVNIPSGSVAILGFAFSNDSQKNERNLSFSGCTAFKVVGGQGPGFRPDTPLYFLNEERSTNAITTANSNDLINSFGNDAFDTYENDDTLIGTAGYSADGTTAYASGGCSLSSTNKLGCLFFIVFTVLVLWLGYRRSSSHEAESLAKLSPLPQKNK